MTEITVDQAWKAMEDIRVAMVTSHTLVGLRSRPLTAQVDTVAELIHFIVPISSDICLQLQTSDDLSLSFMDLKAQNYIAVAATAVVLQDVELAKRLWNSFAQAWFPKGPDDAGVRIIEATPTMIDYWAGEASKLVTTWKLGKALLTKTPPELGEKLTVDYK
jgi:general stress protein 26